VRIVFLVMDGGRLTFADLWLQIRRFFIDWMLTGLLVIADAGWVLSPLFEGRVPGPLREFFSRSRWSFSLSFKRFQSFLARRANWSASSYGLFFQDSDHFWV